MELVESLVKIAKESGFSDQGGCRTLVEEAAQEQRSLISSILDSKLVDETAFNAPVQAALAAGPATPTLATAAAKSIAPKTSIRGLGAKAHTKTRMPSPRRSPSGP